MTYQFDRSQFIENGPTLAAAVAVARIRRAAIYAAFKQRDAEDRAKDLPKAA